MHEILKKKYTAYQVEKENKKYNFLSKCVIYNKKEDSFSRTYYNQNWSYKQDYLYFIQRINKLQSDMLNENRVPIFITLTLSSEYHKYKKIVTKKRTKTTKEEFYLKKNKKYDENLTIEDGYIKLNNQFKILYNKFKIGRKSIAGLKFIKVFEPHKDYTPHLHAVIYVERNHILKYRAFFQRFIKNHNINQYDYEELKSDKYSIVYLLKYVTKTIEGDMSVKGWQSMNNIYRLYTSSNVGLTREIYETLNNYIQYDSESPYTYIDQILNKCNIEITNLYTLKEDREDYSNHSKQDIYKSDKFYEADTIYLGNQNNYNYKVFVSYAYFQTFKKYDEVDVIYDIDITQFTKQRDGSYFYEEFDNLDKIIIGSDLTRRRKILEFKIFDKENNLIFDNDNFTLSYL